MKTRSKRTGSRIVDTVKHHPMPAALAGAGLTWLIGAAVRERRSEKACAISGEEIGYEYEYAGEYPAMYQPGEGEIYPPAEGELEQGEAGSRTEQLKQAGRSAAQTAQQKASELGEQARAKAQQARSAAASKAAALREQASHAGSQLAHQASAMGHQVKEQASHMGQQVRRGSAQASESARGLFEEYPLAVGLGALAAGLLAGLVIPTTRQEDRWMGKTRDELLRGAKDYGGQMLEKGQAVAERAMSAAGEEAQKQHLAPGQVGERAGQVASAAKEAAQDEAKKQANKNKGDDTTAMPGGDKI